MLYGKWLLEWLENYVKPTAKHRTFIRYGEILENHVISDIGDLELAEITPYVLQCYVTRLLNTGNLKNGKGLSSNSVNAIITVIQTSLKTAYMLGLSEQYIGDKIKRPKASEKVIDSLSLAEQKRIEEYIIEKLEKEKTQYFGILLCLYTGLRLGELLALEWNDVDFVKNEIYVNKTCHYLKNSQGLFARTIGTPKTKSSIRTVPLPKQLTPYLRIVKKKSRSTHIVSNGENLISIRSYQRTFSALLRRLNISHRGFHSLRHTFATRALECGMDVKTLSEILGHKSPTITLNRYAHSLTDHKKEMMNRLGKLL